MLQNFAVSVSVARLIKKKHFEMCADTITSLDMRIVSSEVIPVYDSLV